MLDPDNGLPASLDRKVIPSGETARFLYRTFSFTEAAPLLRSALYADTLEIAIKYADIGEGQRTQTVISLAKNLTEHTFRVTNLKLYKCDTYWKSARNRLLRRRNRCHPMMIPQAERSQVDRLKTDRVTGTERRRRR